MAKMRKFTRKPRRFRKRKTSRKKRKFGRKRSVRRIMEITANKYRDTYFGSATDEALGTCDVPIQAGFNCFAFSPTFRELDYNMRATRHNSLTFGKGYRERVLIRVSQPVLWRRIVFWTYERPFGAIPWRVAEPIDTDQEYYTRRLDRKNLFGSDVQLRDIMFRGTLGIDYRQETIHNARVDKEKNRVVFDKTLNVTPNYDASTDEFGKIMEVSMWHAINKNIRYDDIEEGSSKISNGWSAMTQRSPGNMIVVDIFTNGDKGIDLTTQIGTVQMNGTYYWHER